MQRKLPFFIRNLKLILVLILFTKIAGYFSIVEERSINQVFKTISRMGMTGAILYIQYKMVRFGCIKRITHRNVLAPFLYSLYLLLGMASFAWSTNWTYSMLQWSMTFESFIFTYAFFRVIRIARSHFPEKNIDLVELFSWAIFPMMVTFFIGSFAVPDLFYRGMRGGEELRLGGYMMNPNELGMLAGIAGAMGYIFIQQKGSRFWSMLMIFSAVAVLLLTSSRSSAIGYAFIMGILIFKSENKRLKRFMVIFAIIAVPVIINKVVFKAHGGLDEVMSMTGRLPFWKALLNEGIVREPFFGFGFMRINYTEYFQGLNTYPAKMTHNTFMQVLMNLGFVGFFLAFWQLIVTIGNFRKNKKTAYASCFIAIFIPILINSFTEFGIFGEANYGILFYQFLIWMFVVEDRETLTTSEKVKLEIFKKRMHSFRQKNSQIENAVSK